MLPLIAACWFVLVLQSANMLPQPAALRCTDQNIQQQHRTQPAQSRAAAGASCSSESCSVVESGGLAPQILFSLRKWLRKKGNKMQRVESQMAS